MAIFPWDNSYTVGLRQVDDQHRALVGMINRLDEAVSTGQEESAVALLLGQLVDYARYHFATEEALMLEAKLGDHYQRHKHEHDLFADKVAELSHRWHGPKDSLATALLDYLVKWLVDHILGADREMARLILGQETDTHPDIDTNAADLKRAEQKLMGALRESELRFRTLADSVPVLIWMSIPDGRRGFFNQPWCEFTGLTVGQLEQGRWQDHVHPEDRLRLQQAYMGTRTGVTLEYRLRRADGSYRWMLESAMPRQVDGEFAGFVGSCVDITARRLSEEMLRHARDRLEQEVLQRTAELTEANRRLEKDKEEQQALIERLEEAQGQLLQSEKLASIGQLAAGVAHEINNPVGYVKSNLNTLSDYVRDLLRLVNAYAAGGDAQALRREMDFEFLREDVVTLLKESMEGVDRVQQIVRDLKDFAHVDEVQWQNVDLHKALDTALNLVWNELKYKAEVIKDYGELPPIWCLSRQLSQVFMNMLVNAAHAIPEQGSITLRTRSIGPEVVVEISDTGIGIPAEKLTRIFDPFFTTKPVGKGTGLGLSIAYGIIKKHGGHIEVESQPGRGTTFRVVLPVQPPAMNESAA